MKKSLLFFLLFLPLIVVAQKAPGSMLRPLPKSTSNMSVIDTCNLRVWYAFNADSIERLATYIDLHRLEVGKECCKYYSFFVFNSDSLCTVWRSKHPYAKSAPSGLGERGKYPYRWLEYKYSEYFIDYSTVELTEYGRMPMYMHSYNSQSTEPIPIQEWEICNDTVSILGYKCQKAMCSFRGRIYEAWFTMDIPIDKGPWKFSGLPGLIMKVNDEKRCFSFECVKVELLKHGLPIKKYDYDSYKKISREELLKLQKMIHKNYSSKKAISEADLLFSPAYEPLELE